MKNYRFFTKTLMLWHLTENSRELPWKEERNPYKIWLSEIILQQTRTEQGRKYYEAFITRFPTVHDLANAKEEEVYKLWEGLGYYSRCKNLIKTAHILSKEYKGNFPQEYSKILQLPGIGPYTAAAINSFAFNLPYAVVDGNVYRVLSRFFGIFTPIDSTEGKKEFQELAQRLLKKEEAATYNQAIMDFGATICTPANPSCNSCPLSSNCYFLKNNIKANELPQKAKSIKKRRRYFHYFIIKNPDGGIYFEKRIGKDIWENLYQPYLIESDTLENKTDLFIQKIKKDFHVSDKLKIQFQSIGDFQQVLSHQVIFSKWYTINLPVKNLSNELNGSFHTKNFLKKLAFPKTIFSFMSKNPYF